MFLPRWAIATFSLALIFGHNLLDGVAPAAFGSLDWLWMFVHTTGELQPVPGMDVVVMYPLVPWVAVMAAGYVLGPVFLKQDFQRRWTLLVLGAATIAGFYMLRMTNLYGDPAPWSVQDGFVPSVLSFINCEKYPPSLLYLAMTLGPGLVVLALFREARSPLTRAIVTIGRVPFLFYVAHIFLLHAMAVILAWVMVGDVAWLFQRMPVFGKPAGFGLSLAPIYALWVVALLLLYPLCRRFGQIKQARKDWWLSYL